jgi:hypothetical protein
MNLIKMHSYQSTFVFYNTVDCYMGYLLVLCMIILVDMYVFFIFWLWLDQEKTIPFGIMFCGSWF